MRSKWTFLVSLRLAQKLRTTTLSRSHHRLPVLGLSIAIAVLILALSIVNGFEVAMRERVLSVFPQAMVYDAGLGALSQDQIELITSQAEVESVAPVIEMGGLIIGETMQRGVLITAVDPLLEPEVNRVPEFMIAGSWSDFNDQKFGVLLGGRLAERLQVRVGDRVELMLPSVDWSLAGFSTRSKRFKIVGLFDSRTELDETTVYISLQAGEALGRADYRQGLRLKLGDLFTAESLLERLYFEEPAMSLVGSTWMSRQGSLYAAIGLQKQIMFVLLSLLIAIAAFNVTSQLVIFVEEHRPDIAILKTVGAGEGDIRFIFVLQGFFLGLIGTSLGLLLGFLACDVLVALIAGLNQWFGVQLLDEYFVQYLPYERLVVDFISVGLISLVMCVLASWIPARQAGAMIIREGIKDGA